MPWKNDLAAQKAEAARQNANAAKHNAEVAAHNSSCSGTFEDKSYVSACNAAAARLNVYTNNVVNPWRDRVDAWGNRVNDRRQTLVMKEKGLKDAYANLSKGTEDWAKRKKENNYQLNQLQAREQALKARLRVVLNSPSVKDLMKRNKISQECGAIAEQITPGDAYNPSLSTPMERAHNCLQRVWDGAK